MKVGVNVQAYIDCRLIYVLNCCVLTVASAGSSVAADQLVHLKAPEKASTQPSLDFGGTPVSRVYVSASRPFLQVDVSALAGVSH